MITVPITDGMRVRARKFSALMDGSELGQSASYTGLASPDARLVGLLGEYALESLLRERHKKFFYQETIGSADNGDFLVYIPGGHRLLDVKTASQGFHRNIMMPAVQGKKHENHYDYFVGVRLNGSVAEVWGYCRLKDFQLKPDGFDYNKTPTLYKSLSSLQDTEKMLRAISSIDSV